MSTILEAVKMAYVPSGYKAGTTYSVIPDDGTGDFTVARADKSMRVNKSGYLEEVQANVPVIGYDTIGGCPHLETHPSSENLITYPKSLGNSYWTKSGATIEGDSTSTPTNVYTSDFSSGVDGITAQRGTGSGNNDGISDGSTSKDDVYKYYANADNSTHYWYKNAWGHNDGDYIKIAFWYYIPSGQTNVDGFEIIDGVTDSPTATVGTWTYYEKFYAAADDRIDIRLLAGGSDSYVGANSASDDIMYVTEITIDVYSGYDSPLLETVYNTGSELVTNGTFTGSATGWTLQTGFTYNSNAVDVNTVSDTYMSQGSIFATNKLYEVSYEITSYTSGTIRSVVGGSGSAFGEYKSASGVVTEYIYNSSSGSSDIYYLKAGAGGFVGTIDNVSVKEVTSTTTGSPTKDAYKLVEDGTTGQHRTNTTGISGTANSDANFSCYVKGAERLRVRLELSNGVDGEIGCSFNLSDATAGTVSSSGSWSNESCTISSLVDGWYRISITGNNSTSASYIPRILILDASGNKSYTGDGTSGLYIAFPQLEEQSYASPLMLPVTEGSTTTRVADAITGAGSQALFSSVNSAGCLYAEIAANSDDLSNRFVSLSDGTLNNRATIFYSTVSNTIYSDLWVGGVRQCLLSYAVTDITDYSKVAFKWNENDFSLWIDGTEAVTDNSGSIFPSNTITTLQLNSGAGGSSFNGKTKAIYVTEVLTDDEFKALTTP